MEEVENEVTFKQLFIVFLTAFVGLTVVLLATLKRQYAEQVKRDASDAASSAAELASKAQQQHAQLPGSSQAAKKNAAAKQKAIAAEKASHPRHHLDLVTLKGHADAVTGVAFTSTGRGLATACADLVVRVFKLEDAFSKSFKFLRLNLPRGQCPTGVAFGEGASKLVVATQDIGGAGLCLFAAGVGKAAEEARAQGKPPFPEIRWEKQHIHANRNILTLSGSPASYGTGDNAIIVATCSEGTDIKLWKAEDGKCVGTVDTNQLKNTMATLSPNGRFLTAAAFTADVKVWELIYGKDGQVSSVDKVMQLKGHKSAVTWLCFTWDSERIITASKDGTIRIWNINVRYHMDEDPKCLKVFPIRLLDSKGGAVPYERLAVSPDNKVLAVTHGHLLQWLSTETGEVLDTAENAHDGDILSIAWAPHPVPTERGRAPVLATASADKKVKLWFPPALQ